MLYFDKTLSQPDGQSCASCHEPAAGFVDPDATLPVSTGIHAGRFGTRNAPSSAYAMYAPPLHYDHEEGYWEGGQFWDGRARGDELGDPLVEQALGPFLNPLEMANPDKASVIRDIRKADYADLFERVWGKGSLEDIDSAFERVARSIAAFERSAHFAPFNSRYDAFLRDCLQRGGEPDPCAKGQGAIAAASASQFFDAEELRGMALFMGDNNNDGKLEPGEGARCVFCHAVDWTQAEESVVTPSWAPQGLVPPLFTDFTHDNIGVPSNRAHPLAQAEPDLGLGKVLNDARENGKFKVMTLRNIALTAPYAHNGFFTRLPDMVHFYNTRDVTGALPQGADWPQSDVPDNVNKEELGQLGLSEADEKALVEFLQALSDESESFATGDSLLVGEN